MPDDLILGNAPGILIVDDDRDYAESLVDLLVAQGYETQTADRPEAVLQGKITDGAIDFTRFTWNSTVGLLGFFDVATAWELPKHNEDFGQTLGRWGAATGPYLVLPIFGPSNFRDAAGFSVDSFADIVRNLDDVPTRNSLYALRARYPAARARR